MSPRRRLPGAQRRERILRASIRCFARRGFAGTSTRELASAAGISEAMLFKHFPGKDALYRAILARKIEESEAAMPLGDLSRSVEAPRRFLARIADYLLRRVDSDPSFLRLFLYSALEGHPLARAFDRARAPGSGGRSPPTFGGGGGKGRCGASSRGSRRAPSWDRWPGSASPARSSGTRRSAGSPAVAWSGTS